MSTKVQLRREAAAFLATYVGGVGEILADTTNMRLALQDGATPGGFALASARDIVVPSALINGNFGINQRAVSGTVTLAAGAYGHDRWKAGASGCTYTFATAANGDTTLTITAGSLIQALDTPNVYAAAMTASWKGTAPARLWQGTASGSFSTGTAYTDLIDGPKTALLFTGITIGTIANLEFSTGTVALAKLEAAIPYAGLAVPTRFERRHHEFSLCQRYFAYLPLAGGAWDSSPTRFNLSVNFPVPMRAVPTLALVSSGSGVTDPFNANYAVSGLYFSSAIASGAILALTTASATAYRSGFMQSDLKISLNAEV